MRFANIQVLRLVAATAVVLYHIGCHAPTFVGVDPAFLRMPWFGGYSVPLFFAVSGFVLTHAARTATTGRFLAARFLRLYPGYWLAVLVVLALMRTRLFTEHHIWMYCFIDRTALALLPPGAKPTLYVLGIEWSLIYEVFLSVALAVLAVAGVRRVPLLAAAWLAVIVAKMVLWPAYAFDPLPHWSKIAASALNTPFLLGVLAYHMKDRGRRWRWAAVPAALFSVVVVPCLTLTPEWHWFNAGAGSALAVWLVVQCRQLSDRNPLVRLGDCTYGLFLLHVPLLMVVFHAAVRAGWVGRVEVVWLAGAVALAGGLLFGRVEAAMHTRLRPLAKVRPGDVKLAWARFRARIGRPTVQG